MTDYLIETRNLTRQFGARRKLVTAVDNVSLGIYPGEVVCLVGESGCGKTTTGKLFTGLLKPTSGQILYRGKDIWKQDAKGFKEFRLGVQIIHQDPYASLNPSHTIYKTISTPLLHHHLVEDAEEAHERARWLLRTVDLTPEDDFLSKYPHQLSGGQRQRVSVARSLTVNPKVIIADEAVSMVDVSIRVGLLNMLSRLKKELGVTFLFITHDLAVAKFFGWEGRVAVMYVGSMVEIAATPQLINEALHPYSMALLAAVPEANPEITRHKERVALRSQDVPNLVNLPSGCHFHPRCPLFEKGLCDVQIPVLTEVKPSHFVACHVAVRKAREQAG
jgi:oligopeptide/dipeptide ABC transporter ATP-binding protein